MAATKTASNPFWTVFRVVAIVFFIGAVANWNKPTMIGAFSALLIIVASLMPAYVWVNRGGRGIPLFALHAMLYVPAFAYPLLLSDERIVIYSPIEQFTAALTVVAFLLAGTLAWRSVKSDPSRRPENCLAVPSEHMAENLFLFFLGIGSLYTVIVAAGIQPLPTRFVSIGRTMVSGLSAVSIFFLYYWCGRGLLSRGKLWTLSALCGLQMLAGSTGLILAFNITIIIPLIVGYFLGSKKFPLKIVAFFIVILTLLHYGKTDMRDKYWSENSRETISITQYPSFYREWLGYSFEAVYSRLRGQKEQKAQRLTERTSLIHLLLLIQRESPERTPYLDGATIRMIPLLLIPRLFYPEKPVTHAGQRLLNTHYGLQTEADSEKTFISWGILNESMANYGFWGVIIVGAVWGFALAQIEEWSRWTPIFSYRTVITIALLRFTVDNGMAMGVLAAGAFQAVVAVTAVCYLIMRPIPNPREETGKYDEERYIVGRIIFKPLSRESNV